MEHLAPILWSLPWVLLMVIVIVRARHSLSLDDVSDSPPTDAPLVSIIIPARNESRNIERCARSVLGAAYPHFEVVVVDDHSTDGTAEIARAIAREDSRLRVIEAPALPQGWFGKQWACATGARDARGELLIFTDADTRHSPDLLPRAVNGLRARDADLLSVAGKQEMHSFWERIIQPQMFALLLIRYGGSEHVSRTRRPVDAIANGQFILVRRDSYDAIGGQCVRSRSRGGGHGDGAGVRRRAPPYRALRCQRSTFNAHVRVARRAHRRLGQEHLRRGTNGGAWRIARPRRVSVVASLAMPLLGLAPVPVLLASLFGIAGVEWLVWSGIVITVSVLFWAAVYRYMGESVGYALLYPLGFVMLLVIALGGVRRGQRVEWKQRTYLSS